MKAYHRRPVQRAINKLATNPRPKKSEELGRKYKGRGIRRLPVGDWRIIYKIYEIDKLVFIKDVRFKTGPETYDDIYID